MALDNNHLLAGTLWLTLWTECSEAVLVWNRLIWSWLGSFMHLPLAGDWAGLWWPCLRQLEWLGPLSPCVLSSSSKLGLEGVQEHQEGKPQWASFSQVSAYTVFVNISLAKASHMPKVVSKVREINDTDLTMERAVKSHCRRAWIKEEEISGPCLHLQQVILKWWHLVGITW